MMKFGNRVVRSRRGRTAWRWGILLVSAIAVWAAATCPSAARNPAHSQTTAKFEINFMRNMIDHHTGAVAMGKLAERKATHQALRNFGKRTVVAQGAEIAKMQSWLKQWYGVTKTPRITPSGRRMVARLERLRGPVFEQAFLNEMQMHHAEAISMSTPCTQHAKHPELKKLCKSIITKQTEEKKQLRGWLNTWYGTRK